MSLRVPEYVPLGGVDGVGAGVGVGVGVGVDGAGVATVGESPPQAGMTRHNASVHATNILIGFLQ